MQENYNKLLEILNKYNYTSNEKEYLLNLIMPIFEHDEFQKRMTNEFQHHNEITLGEHILSDAAVTYKLVKSNHKKIICDVDTSVIIAMFHDLYTLCWQNNPESKSDKFYNLHGFRHPIEAIINAINWYPDYFKDPRKAEIIIDGVIHHMYPLPVRRVDGTNMELKSNNIDSISDELKQLIIFSSNKGIIVGHLSLSKSDFVEGRIMSKADKIVSIDNYKNDFNLSSLSSLLTGENKNLNNNRGKKR